MNTKDIKGVAIDSGHSGNDSRAVSDNLLEKDLNLKAAQYLYKRLQELGIPTTIVKSTDETLSREERIRRIMTAYGNNQNAILISNHINIGGGESTYGYNS